MGCMHLMHMERAVPLCDAMQHRTKPHLPALAHVLVGCDARGQLLCPHVHLAPMLQPVHIPKRHQHLQGWRFAGGPVFNCDESPDQGVHAP